MSNPLCSLLGLSLGLLSIASPWAGANGVAYELNSNYAYGGGARMDFGQFKGCKNGDVSEQSALLRFVASPQLTESVLLRLGAEWQRFSFGLPAAAPLPNTLQSTSLVAGVDMEAFSNWIFRVETAPGFYSDSGQFDGRDFNAPIILGGSYIASADLQWIIGCEINLHNCWPVLPGAGVRWKFAEKWVLNAILPTPRLEYTYSKSLILYAGADLKMGAYRLDDRFGTAHGVRGLNGKIVDYTELRAGCGASWKFTRRLALELEAGYMPYREFDFHHTKYDVDSLHGSPYGQIAIGGRF